MTIYPNRRGITLFELLWGVIFLAAALWVLSRPSHRAVEIVRVMSGDIHYDSLVAVVAFILTLFIWLCIAVGIYRLRLRYDDLLYFPMMVGLPLGFAVVPFRPFALPIYAFLLVMSMVATPLVLFLLQSAIVLFYRATTHRKRNPIPESLPPYTLGHTPYRDKPIKNIKDLPPHPNVTQAWADYHNSIGIHHSYAVEAWLYDNDAEEFRDQLSIHCRRLLLHYKQPSGYVRFWSRETKHLEEIVKSYAALDFEDMRDWAEYVRATLPMNRHILSMRDERLIRAMCAVILNEDDELERLNHELAEPIGWLDRMVTREPMYWNIFLAGLAERDIERCREAVRIQAEEWYIPVLSNYYRLNVNGVAMVNLCRWRGIPVPPLEPVIPELLLLQDDTL